MTTIYNHLHALNDSSAYCPCCGNTKLVEEDYCLDCYLQSEDIVLSGEDWEPEPMYPYEPLPVYTVGYLSDTTSWCP